ncbi:MAG: DUF615 domain-containing protein, partial [Desulfovibrio sp.]|nr:DUF615 domain-containing protein [Desulfovibrio sp.]
MARRTTFQWEAGASSDDQVEKISRSEKKRRALALQNLGNELVLLDTNLLDQLDIPPDLQAAVA